jgi:hypothetical protein
MKTAYTHFSDLAKEVKPPDKGILSRTLLNDDRRLRSLQLRGRVGRQLPLASKMNWKMTSGPVCGTNTKRFDGSDTMACALSALGIPGARTPLSFSRWTSMASPVRWGRTEVLREAR